MNEEKIYYDSTDKIKLCGLLSKVNDSKQIVILCHGYSGNKLERNSFTALTEELINNNCNSFRFDFRSHGESSGIDYEMTISGEIDDLEATIKLLEEKGYNEFILLGASFGASIISLIDYNKHKNVGALISWYGALDYNDLANDIFTNDKLEIAKKEGYYTRIKPNGKVTRMGLKLFDEIHKFKPDDSLSKLDLPVLFVHGTIDTSVPCEVSKRVSDMCKNSILKLIEGGWHTFDNSEDALKEAVKETVKFVKEFFI